LTLPTLDSTTEILGGKKGKKRKIKNNNPERKIKFEIIIKLKKES